MPVKLLLVEDVEDLGRSGDIVNVKPGYARNLLLPQGLGVLADKKALRMQAKLQEERKKKAIIDRQESEQLASKLDGTTLSTIVKVDHEGHMYGSVSALDVAHLLQEQTGIVVEKRAIQLKHAFKETGIYPINIKLKEGIAVSIKLKVIPENGELPSEEVAGEEAVKKPEGEEKPEGKKKSSGRKKKADTEETVEE